jgi:hypothetical protein
VTEVKYSLKKKGGGGGGRAPTQRGAILARARVCVCTCVCVCVCELQEHCHVKQQVETYHRVGQEFGCVESKHPDTLYSACLHMKALDAVQLMLTGHMHTADAAPDDASRAFLLMLEKMVPSGQFSASRR